MINPKWKWFNDQKCWKTIEKTSNLLCPFPCPPSCSSCWRICPERAEMFLNLHLKILLRPPGLYCHIRHKRAAAAGLEKHPHPLGNSLAAGSTAPLHKEREISISTTSDFTTRRTRTTKPSWVEFPGKATTDQICTLNTMQVTLDKRTLYTYSHPSCRTSASWLFSEWLFQHML